MRTNVKLLMLSLVLGATACTNEVENVGGSDNLLNLAFNVSQPAARVMITDEYLPEGSRAGAMLVGEGYDAYSNVCFTASGTGENQTWASDNVYLTSKNATLYSYYPYSGDADASALNFETATQTDYMYGTPLTSVSSANPSANVYLNHALANLKISVVKGSYPGEGNISSVAVLSDGIATGGVFNAAQATPDYSDFSGVGSAVVREVESKLGGTPVDVMVIPTGTADAISFSVVVDGITFTSASSDITLQKGLSYSYTLKLNSTQMSIATSGVAQWGEGEVTDEGPIDMSSSENKASWNFLDNGAYAISAEGNPVKFEDADETCVGVALVVNDAPVKQLLMIGESGNLQAEWGPLWNDIIELPNYSTVDGTNGYGYLNGSKQPFLSTDYKSWTQGALSDFNGKENSKLLPVDDDNYMGAKLKKRNEEKKDGYNDWYIPACGQMGLVYLYLTEINKVRVAIGQEPMKLSSITNFYWTSTEESENDAYCISLFKEHEVVALGKDCCNFQMTYDGAVIYVRDIVLE